MSRSQSSERYIYISSSYSMHRLWCSSDKGPQQQVSSEHGNACRRLYIHYNYLFKAEKRKKISSNIVSVYCQIIIKKITSSTNKCCTKIF